MTQPSRALIAEPPLLVLPSLAVAVGLNQAILLQQLHFLGLTRRPDRRGDRWVEMGNSDLLHTFPFWSRNTVWRMVYQLRDLGLVTVRQADGGENAYRLEYPAIELAVAKATHPKMGRDPAQTGEGTLPKMGSPTIKELSEKSSKQHAGEDDSQAPQGPAPLEPMSLEWKPDDVTAAVIRRTGVPDSFVAEVLPEFRLYWMGQGTMKPWGATFAGHVRRQWAMKPKERAPSDRPYAKPGDNVSGKLPEGAAVVAAAKADPTKVTPGVGAAALAELKKALR